jgi:hypothetical protein
VAYLLAVDEQQQVNGFVGYGGGDLTGRQLEMSHPTALKTKQDTNHRSIRGNLVSLDR